MLISVLAPTCNPSFVHRRWRLGNHPTTATPTTQGSLLCCLVARARDAPVTATPGVVCIKVWNFSGALARGVCVRGEGRGGCCSCLPPPRLSCLLPSRGTCWLSSTVFLRAWGDPPPRRLFAPPTPRMSGAVVGLLCLGLLTWRGGGFGRGIISWDNFVVQEGGDVSPRQNPGALAALGFGGGADFPPPKCASAKHPPREVIPPPPAPVRCCVAGEQRLQ